MVAPKEAALIASLSEPTSLTAHPVDVMPVTSAPGPVQGPIQTAVQLVLDAFSGVFPEENPLVLPPLRPIDHRVDLIPDAVPPSHCIFRNAHAEEVELRRQLDVYLAHGWIEPAHSAFGAGVLFAQKHDGTKRMCVDYRRPNDIANKVVYPMPRIDECLEHMRVARIFTNTDLRSGFHQILISTSTAKGLRSKRVVGRSSRQSCHLVSVMHLRHFSAL